MPNKTTKTKNVRLKPFEKMLNLMLSGQPVTKEEFESKIGDQIEMYRISTYVWHMKTIANAIVRVIKDGRKVVAYQVINVAAVTEYLKRVGVFQPQLGTPEKVQKLADLKAEPIDTVTTKVKTKKVTKQTETAPEVLEVTEITQ